MATRPNQLTSLLLLLIILGGFSISIYTVAFPVLSFTTNSNANMIQFSLTLFLIGAGLSPLFFGPYSDKYGRRNVLLSGLALFIIGTILCTFLPSSVYFLLIGRLLEGWGIGCTSTLAYAIVRDISHDNLLAKRIALLSLASACSLFLSPLIGGYLVYYFSWQTIFIFLFALALLSFTLLFFMFDETKTTLEKGLPSFLPILKSSSFSSYGLCASIAFSLPVTASATVPLLFFTYLKLSANECGIALFIIELSFFIGGLCCRQLSCRVGLNGLIYLGLLMMFIASASGLLLAALGYVSYFSILIPLIFALFGAGLVFPGSLSAALLPLANQTGTASALLSAGIFLATSVVISVIAYLPEATPIPLMALLLVLALITLLVFWLGTPQPQPLNQQEP